ncbi:hypothetical protein IE4872_CH00872 [Rhizobium gallicum]|uniref:Uncharacterized protein n=1 Tax=Rhizobium gallicum TaxID=56730 RepID=A0A1L5NF54_9HYPH|nr:hypothetical protein IE4872_CH00872 [Rhizobium gallicum]
MPSSFATCGGLEQYPTQDPTMSRFDERWFLAPLRTFKKNMVAACFQNLSLPMNANNPS